MNVEFFLKVYVADTVAMVAERTLTDEKTQGRHVDMGITRVPSIMEED